MDRSERMLGGNFQPKPGPDRNFIFAVLVSLVALISLGFSVFTYIEWQNFRHKTEASLSSQANDSKTYLGSTLKGFEERITNLEKIMEPFSLLKPEATLEQVIEKTNSEIEDRNEERFRKVQAKIDAMTEEVVKARERVEAGNKRELLFISLIKLRQKMDAAIVYGNELDILQLAAGRDKNIQDNIDILRKRADKGISSVVDLRDEFGKIAGPLFREQKQEEIKEMPFYKKFTENLYKGISIRKVKNIDGDSAEASIARTEEALKKGNINLALQELEKINMPDNEQLSNWLEKAKAYREADNAFNNILGRIIDEDAEKIVKENQTQEGR